MLPFLKRRNIVSVVIAKQSPEGSVKEESSDDYDKEALKMAMTDLLKAIEAKDIDAMADAFEAAAEVCEGKEPMSEPEGE